MTTLNPGLQAEIDQAMAASDTLITSLIEAVEGSAELDDAEMVAVIGSIVRRLGASVLAGTLATLVVQVARGRRAAT